MPINPRYFYVICKEESTDSIEVYITEIGFWKSEGHLQDSYSNPRQVNADTEKHDLLECSESIFEFGGDDLRVIQHSLEQDPLFARDKNFDNFITQ